MIDALYLMFNEGYAATAGDQLVRDEVALEAIRLARMLAAHPATVCPRVWALLALMLLHAARFPARVDSEGTLFLLREQDRGNGIARLIAEGLHALDRARRATPSRRCISRRASPPATPPPRPGMPPTGRRSSSSTTSCSR